MNPTAAAVLSLSLLSATAFTAYAKPAAGDY
jgi:hypothetical protein